MKLQIHPNTLARLTRELAQAGRREIGGVLVGEHLDRNTFRIADLSVQRHGGEEACFVRRPAHHKGFLDDFFARTGDAYDRFNYLGEWHSHPSFSTEPSGTDLLQMHEIVNDGPSGPPFAILLGGLTFVTATVGIGPRSDKGFGLDVALEISLPGVDKGAAEALVAEADTICPYSHATRGNIDVRLSVA